MHIHTWRGSQLVGWHPSLDRGDTLFLWHGSHQPPVLPERVNHPHWLLLDQGKLTWLKRLHL